MEAVNSSSAGLYPASPVENEKNDRIRRLFEEKQSFFTPYDFERDLRLYETLEKFEAGSERKKIRASKQQDSQKEKPQFLRESKELADECRLILRENECIIEKVHGDYEFGVAALQGKRSYMEDTFYFGEICWGRETALLACVFDGHGGCDSSGFLKEYFSSYLQSALKEQSPPYVCSLTIARSLQSACLEIDLLLGDHSGSTATIAMIHHNTVYFANIGDSRGVISHKDTTTQATVDAVLMPPTEDRERLESDEYKFTRGVLKRGGEILEFLGGHVRASNGVALLGMGRAFGDSSFSNKEGNKFVVARPEITHYPLNKEDIIILASDGLWDVASTNEVGDYSRELNSEGCSSKKIALSLSVGALIGDSKKIFSSDNTTTLVVKKNSRE